MSKAILKMVESRFESIKRLRGDGTEFWSGRDLMPSLGYSKWERFAEAITRAMDVAHAMELSVDVHFVRLEEKSGEGAGRPREDYLLSRYGAYLVAMNGDPRKPAIGAAMHYFAARTRQAELAESASEAISRTREELLLDALANRVSARLEVVIMARLDGVMPSLTLPTRSEPADVHAHEVSETPSTVRDLTNYETYEPSGMELMTAREYCQAIGLPNVTMNARSLGQHGAILAAELGVRPKFDPPSSHRPLYPASIWNMARKRQTDLRLRKGLHPDTGN